MLEVFHGDFDIVSNVNSNFVFFSLLRIGVANSRSWLKRSAINTRSHPRSCESNGIRYEYTRLHVFAGADVRTGIKWVRVKTTGLCMNTLVHNGWSRRTIKHGYIMHSCKVMVDRFSKHNVLSYECCVQCNTLRAHTLMGILCNYAMLCCNAINICLLSFRRTGICGVVNYCSIIPVMRHSSFCE